MSRQQNPITEVHVLGPTHQWSRVMGLDVLPPSAFASVEIDEDHPALDEQDIRGLFGNAGVAYMRGDQ